MISDTTNRPATSSTLVEIGATTFDIVADMLGRLHPDVARDKLRPDATLGELDIDSLSLMEFVFAIEDRFQVRIPEQQLDVRQPDLTLQKVCDALDAAVVARTA